MATLGVAAAAAGAGTYAAFSDTEESNDNSLSAGTLDLTAGDTNTISFTSSDIKPTDDGTADLDLNNSGSVNGDLSIEVSSVKSTEGDDTDSETNTDTNDGGELDDQLEIALWLGEGGSDDNTMDSSDVALESDPSTSTGSKVFDTAANYDGASWSNVITDFSGPVTFNVEWKFPDQNNNNAAQGDDLTVDFTFDLVQS